VVLPSTVSPILFSPIAAQPRVTLDLHGDPLHSYVGKEHGHLLRIKVLTLVIRLIIFALMLMSTAVAPPAPNAGSVPVLLQPMRARKRSSERMAMAFVRRTVTIRRALENVPN
jgi:hypothetical protein